MKHTGIELFLSYEDMTENEIDSGTFQNHCDADPYNSL